MPELKSFVQIRDSVYQDAYDLPSTGGHEASEMQLSFIAGMAALGTAPLGGCCQEAAEVHRLRAAAAPHVLSRGRRIMLARALTGAGRTVEARRVYEDAFRIWQHADTDLPLLVRARADSAQLLGTN